MTPAQESVGFEPPPPHAPLPGAHPAKGSTDHTGANAGLGRRRQGPSSRLHAAGRGDAQAGTTEQRLNKRTETREAEAWSLAARARPDQCPEPGRPTQDTEGLSGDSEQTRKLSLAARTRGRWESSRAGRLGTKDQFWQDGERHPAHPQGTSGHTLHSRDRDVRAGIPCTVSPPAPPGRAPRGRAAAGPTSAARMRRLFSSVQRSERTPGCARSSSAAASTQPAVQAAQAMSAPRPHRQRRPHLRSRPRSPAAGAMASPACSPLPVPCALRPALASRLRGSAGEEGQGEAA